MSERTEAPACYKAETVREGGIRAREQKSPRVAEFTALLKDLAETEGVFRTALPGGWSAAEYDLLTALGYEVHQATRVITWIKGKK